MMLESQPFQFYDKKFEKKGEIEVVDARYL